MSTNPQKLSSPETQELRREAGKLVKHLREQAGHSQRSLSAEIGSLPYTFVSQIETGRSRVPPDQIPVWADAFGIDARRFLLMIMRFYDPETFAVLFEEEPSILSGEAFPELLASRDNPELPGHSSGVTRQSDGE
ncbi:helix-turn-helix domain-containing protein [Methylobacterium planeticum]|uniref:Helix-turn-helix transcriptional regulator n=1 Tax=Methylobacterium planeticum TaxID=2615211 RepID=A0A6N6MI27_9HYPH|nr:helix-turn-helix transcriptional regulator [Methylobacterium planeticum]KAB1070027.1 helix-turn-helix transcriptional regulator [Methylobacterium planeticum]